jgi:hypothetical protein
MSGLFNPVAWGSPVGIAIFFVGLGVLLWGVGHLPENRKKK